MEAIKIKVKICGLSRIQDIEAVNRYLPDFIGFIFAKSKRQIDYNTASELKGTLHPSIKAVGVFVNEEINPIISLCNQHVIDYIQLHGDEQDSYIKELKKNIKVPIIQAKRVRHKEDIAQIQKSPADLILLDAYHEEAYGGVGKSFDWSLINDLQRPYFLAGGIHSGNLTKVMSSLNAYGIDISSGVETNGRKDIEKIKQIMEMIRSVN